jgi:hypothetical protein
MLFSHTDRSCKCYLLTRPYDYNAFPAGAATFPIGGARNVYVDCFDWQTSLLGNYYLPSDSPLIAAGDLTADQIGLGAYIPLTNGLSGFTTQTNQTPEGNAIVDIGYHYMAYQQIPVCISAPGGQLAIGTPSFCIGEPASGVATWTDVPGSVAEHVFDGDGNWVMVTNLAYATILANWNVVNWNGMSVTNWGSGTNSSFSFTPTTAGWETNMFYFTYSNPTPCDAGPYTISISNTFAVFAVASLAPWNGNSTTWFELSNNTPGTRTFLVRADTNYGQTMFHVKATPTPPLDSFPVPECWQITHEEGPFNAILDISTTAVYEVDCVCGTSALTNLIYVTTNTFTTNAGYITNGLVAWWKMSDAPDTPYATDSSGNVVNVPLIGSPSWSPDCLTLNGTTQYGDAGSNALTILDTNDMTICAWINTRSTNLQGIVAKDYSSSMGYGGWWFAIENNQLSWNLLQNTYDLHDTGAARVSPGVWTFVAVTWSYSNKQAYFYINGIVNSYPSANGVNQNPSGLAHLFVGNIQNSQNYANYPLDGSIRGVAIYNCVLTTNQILTNFINTESSTYVRPPDLLYYKMTEAGETNNLPLVLTNRVTNGEAANGTVWNTNLGILALPDWVDNPGGYPTAIHLHGTNVTQINAYDPTDFNFTTNPFTINVWLGAYGNGYYIMGNDTVSNSGWYLKEAPGSHCLIFGGETNNHDYAIETTSEPEDWGDSTNWLGEWYMITITYDGTNTPLIYVNATLQATTGTFQCPAPSSNNLVFGHEALSDGNNDYDGDLWLPQIWSTNLSPIDVANLYYRQKTGIPWP